MGVSDTTEKDWAECFEDYVRFNSFEINTGSMVINMNKVLEGIGHYNHCEECNRKSRIPEPEDEIAKLKCEIKHIQSDNLSLKNMIVKMCYDRYGE